MDLRSTEVEVAIMHKEGEFTPGMMPVHHRVQFTHIHTLI